MALQWKEKDNKLEKTLKFDSQTELAEFVLKVAKLSDKEDHHCDMEVSKAYQLKLTLTTHEEGGKLTEQDYTMAQSIDTMEK